MRRISFIRSVFGLLFVTMGCGAPERQEPSASHRPSISNYTRQTNGTGIHIATTQPESWFGLANTSTAWFTTGFAQRQDGKWLATGWYSADAVVLSADAVVVSARVDGVPFAVQSIRTLGGTQLSIDLKDSAGSLHTRTGAGLVGVTLKLSVPDPLGLTVSPYYLRISSAEAIESQFGDVAGYQIDVLQAGLIGSSWSSYCQGGNGQSQRAVFYQGSQWNPLTAARTDGAGLVTLTCESGSVAKCMRWGYRPWASATVENGEATLLRDHHQACVHMKRASYCGNSSSYTIDGTALYLRDQLGPPIWSGSLDRMEAWWAPSGARCISSRRHPELPFLGCGEAVPSCSTSAPAGSLIASGLADDGDLLSLRD